MNPFAEILKVAERIEKIGEACDAPIYNLLMDQQEKLLAAASPEAVAFWEAAGNHFKLANDAGVTKYDPLKWRVRSYSEAMDAYHALVARAK